jgi:hypothetical protein
MCCVLSPYDSLFAFLNINVIHHALHFSLGGVCLVSRS